MRQPDAPGAVIVEDLHWADPSTLEWLDLLVEELPSLPVLLLALTRPPSLPAWLSRTHASEISLGKLTPEDLASITRHRSGDKPLPPEIVRHVAARTDGVPLFAEELTSMILESGLLRDAGDRYELTGPVPEHLIPATLHGSLMARLDQQASARQVAQIGAVIGRRFPYALLRAVDEEGDDESLTQALNRLVEAELLTRRGFIPEATFEFRHALIRDAAYESLLRKRRRELHERAAVALSEGPFDATPAAVARHYTEAGLPAKALPLRVEAGRTAMRRNANREAVEQLRAGLELLGELDEGPGRDAHELEVLSLLGPAVMMTKGYADPEGEEIFLRIQEICRRVNAMQPLFFSLYGLVSVYLIRGEYDRSFDILARSLETAEKVGETRYLVMSHNATGVARMFAGQPAEALRHLDAVLRLHDPDRDADLALLGWGRLDVSAATSRQLALQLLGRSDEALAQCRDALAVAEGSPNHMTVYHAHLYAGLLYLMRREWAACREVMQAYLPMAIEYGDPFYIAIATVVSSLAHRQPGQEDTFRLAGTVLDRMRSAGYALGLGFLLGHLADGLLAKGETVEAVSVVDDALRYLGERNGEFWEAEVFRLKGAIEAALGRDPEPWIDRAIETSRRQGARWLELRATTDLARRRLEAGRSDEALKLVRDALAGLAGGDGLSDLEEARALAGRLESV
jgi:tetratricopeptide (TPR) repeat protein